MWVQYRSAVSINDRHFGNAAHALRIASRRQPDEDCEIDYSAHNGSSIEIFMD
jgi:hypothetical protein